MPIFDSMREVAAKRREEAEKQRLAAEAAKQARIVAERKRQAEREAAILAEKRGIIERNSSFFEQVISLFYPNRIPELPWIAQKETYLSTNIRHIFIGYMSLHIYFGDGLPHDMLDKEKVWPEATWYSSYLNSMQSYKKISFSYPDHFNYAPISGYANQTKGIFFTKEEMLSLVSEEINNQLKQNFPSFTVSEIRLTKKDDNSDMYYYFQYEAPYKELTSW